MIVKGKIAQVMGIEKGTSQRTGAEWRSQEFVIEYYENPSDRYPDRVALRIMNEKIDQLNLQVGDECSVGFGHSIREYNGRFYNELRIYTITKVSNTQTMQPTEAPMPPQSPTTGGNGEAEGNDLPF